tara:strand:- start:1604 stop:1744 length:141 start_codon:yes stop_codon:yes gene_type:complete
MERFSMKQVIANKYGETEKNTKTARSTKRSQESEILFKNIRNILDK